MKPDFTKIIKELKEMIREAKERGDSESIKNHKAAITYLQNKLNN